MFLACLSINKNYEMLNIQTLSLSKAFCRKLLLFLRFLISELKAPEYLCTISKCGYFFRIAFNFEVFCNILLPEYDWCCINSLSKDIFLKISPNFIFQWNQRHFWKLVIKSAKTYKKIFFQHIFILITFNLNELDWLN